MDAAIFLGVAIAVLCGVAYLIGHTHGKSATPTTVVVGSGSGTPTPSTKDSTGTQAQS